MEMIPLLPPNFGGSTTPVSSNTAIGHQFLYQSNSEISFDSLEQWSFEVKKRFQFKCLILTTGNHRLESHHLYSKKKHPALSLEILNGIPLTVGLHQLFHKIYGYHTTIDDFIHFIGVLQESKFKNLDYIHLKRFKNYLKKLKPVLEAKL